jgi:hypothetical protein
MTTTEYSKSIIATACWSAASGELPASMFCVCMVFMNRAKEGWWEGSLYENCAAWVREHADRLPDIRDPQFQTFLTKLDTVLSGLVPDKTGGALYFFHKDQVTEELKPPFKITATVGNMIFVR